MAKRAKQTLREFLEFALSDPDKPKAITLIALVHKVGMRDEEVCAVPIGDGGRAPEAEKLADLLSARAEHYAQDLPGVQTFQVLCFYGTDHTTHGNRYLIMVNNNQRPGEDGSLWTEAPDAQGQTMQRMRHTEMGMQQIFNRQQTLDNYSLRLIDQQSNIISKLMHENADGFQIIKEVLLTKALDDRQFLTQMAQEKQSAETRKLLLGLVPSLANTITGREVFPQSAEDTALVNAMAEHIEPEMMPFIESALPKPVLALLMPRINKALEEKKQAKEAEAAYTKATIGEGPTGEKTENDKAAE